MSAARDILFLAQRVPYPPDRGDRITTWHVLRHFLDAGHRVRVGCFLETRAEEASVGELGRLGVEVTACPLRPGLRRALALPWLLTSRPLTVPYFVHRGLRARLRRQVAARPPDLCYAYSSSMGFYMLALGPELAAARKVAHFAELDSDKWAQYAASRRFPARQVYAREARRLLDWERRVAACADRNVVCSPIEQDLFEERIPGCPVTVLPNGVDLDAFRPGPAEKRRDQSIVFTGVMSYAPNVDAVLYFLARCWPGIRARFPAAELFVVGSAPVRRLVALDGRDGVTVTGRVPSTLPWLQKARVAVAPLRIARGIQNKVLEAMACGLPVVASPKAFQGIDAVPGEHLVVAEGGRMTTAVLRLLEDPAAAAALGAAARRRVEERYAWSRVLAGLAGICGF